MVRTKILIVDDEPEIRSLLCRVLSRQGYDVEEAGDGVEALALCQRGSSFDLLLTDVVMPRMDGVQLAERVRTLHPAVRVLYMSGKCDVESIQRQVGTKGFGFILKPFQLGHVSRTIRTHLRRPAAGRSEQEASDSSAVPPPTPDAGTKGR